MNDWLGPNCHDCGAYLDEEHGPGCDFERCTVCGDQRFLCELAGACEGRDTNQGHDPAAARWRGESPWLEAK
jgi:hypothetical protein